MAIDFRLLKVTQTANEMVAVAPVSKLIGAELNELLHEDLQRIVQHATGPVVLDLHDVTSIDRWFFSRLLELQKSLKQRSIRLTIRVSPELAEAAMITKMDQILEIVPCYTSK